MADVKSGLLAYACHYAFFILEQATSYVMVSMMSWTFSSSRDEKVYIEIQCGRMSSIAQFAGFYTIILDLGN